MWKLGPALSEGPGTNHAVLLPENVPASHRERSRGVHLRYRAAVPPPHPPLPRKLPRGHEHVPQRGRAALPPPCYPRPASPRPAEPGERGLPSATPGCHRSCERARLHLPRPHRALHLRVGRRGQHTSREPPHLTGALTQEQQLDLPGRLLAILPQVPVDHLAPLHRRLVLGAQCAAHFGKGAALPGREKRREAGERRGSTPGAALRREGSERLPALFLLLPLPHLKRNSGVGATLRVYLTRKRAAGKRRGRREEGCLQPCPGQAEGHKGARCWRGRAPGPLLPLLPRRRPRPARRSHSGARTAHTAAREGGKGRARARREGLCRATARAHSIRERLGRGARRSRNVNEV